MSLILSMDFQYTTSIEKAWAALTDSSKLAKWITENDFKPIVGHRFQFRHEPSEYWDGIVDGEVLIVEPPNRLSYSWATGDERHTVTWTLQDLGDGKVNLHLEQTGFSNVHGLEGARYGWSEWFGKFEQVVLEQ
ncbi:SRPBCC domain-containing protein [Paenibacillus lautus]|uniref:SRPBCC family protein n=1 Tax=Paenibacillus lautus TaxID=1401 RepID=UPI002DBFBE17|nr:SRPBCC domain-containing protein [Paenibacillus lautus]MEC0201907.1 SRPBCC domain-containing protein [Paenibacillus lautus]